MHGLPRLSAAQAAVSDYTALARTRLNELKVILSCQMLTFSDNLCWQCFLATGIYRFT